MPLENETNRITQKKWFFPVCFIVCIVVALLIFNVLSGGTFLTWNNLKGIINHVVYPSLIAWAFCFLFACGYTDMSIGGVMVLGSFASCILGNWYGIPGVVIGGLITGLVLIIINFLVFNYTGIPSWIAGISLAMIYEAIAFFMKVNQKTNGLISVALERKFRSPGQLPFSIIILIIAGLIVYLVYNRTTVGLNTRALGGNKNVAQSLGVNVSATLMAVGLICGILIGFSCFLQECYAGQTTPKTGLTSINLIFQPLAIYLLAQTLSKKINIVICVPICGFILYAIFNLLTIMGVPSGTLQEAFLGAFIIVFSIIGQSSVKGVVK